MSTIDWATRPLAWSFTATTEPDYWGPIFHYLALTTQATISSVGLPHTLYGIDWRRLPIERWLDLIGKRELTGETGPPPPELLRPAPLDRTRFDQAVRHALTHLNRPDRLTANPLLYTSLAADPTPACLRATLLTAIDHLSRDPRSLPLRRVLDRTYLHPAPTQEADDASRSASPSNAVLPIPASPRSSTPPPAPPRAPSSNAAIRRDSDRPWIIAREYGPFAR
jgi:hypothetical protein